MDFVKKIVVKEKGILVEANIMLIGDDFLVIVTGGDKPHIGAISYGNVNEENNIALGEHKELFITEKMFKKLKNICNNNLLITGGIHIDNITKEQIGHVLENCELLIEKISEV
ncbi:MAG: hypothetical protein EWM47_09670, partial [Anaerolineaceae bacterium]